MRHLFEPNFGHATTVRQRSAVSGELAGYARTTGAALIGCGAGHGARSYPVAGKVGLAAPGSGTWRGRLGNVRNPVRASVCARAASIGMASR